LIDLFGLRGKGALLIAGLVLIGWVNAGIYKVQPDEQGVVLRFGHWVESTGPGLHYHWPWPIEAVILPKVTQVNQIHLGSARTAGDGGVDDSHRRQILTGDENIVEAECAVFWRIKDAGQFLFRVKDAEGAVRVEAESALREVLSVTPIQAAMSDRRQQIADRTRELLQSLLDHEAMGVLITEVQLQRVDPPAAVIDAFNDVQRARADQERARNEAESYANDIIPRARGEAAHIVQEAEAYRAQVANLADGDAQSFLSIYKSYAGSKDVTAWRLYLDTVDEVLRKSGRVVVDASGRASSGVVPLLHLGDPASASERAPGAVKEGGK
jgi:membrane protease subunit HflK